MLTLLFICLLIGGVAKLLWIAVKAPWTITKTLLACVVLPDSIDSTVRFRFGDYSHSGTNPDWADIHGGEAGIAAEMCVKLLQIHSEL